MYDFNKDTTNESSSMACSNILLWKLDTQKNEEARLHAFELKGQKDSAGTDSKEKRCS